MDQCCEACGSPLVAGQAFCTGCGQAAGARQEAASWVRLEGYLLFLPYAAGSKSETMAPHLVVDPATVHRLHREGDNPFTGSSLAPFHRCYVEIAGEWEAGGRFLRVRQCQEKEQPWRP